MNNKKTSFIPNWHNLIKFLFDPKADWKPKFGIFLAILYVVWPIDLIPDFAPFLGWLDDIGFTIFVTGYLFQSINNYTVNKEGVIKKIEVEVHKIDKSK